MTHETRVTVDFDGTAHVVLFDEDMRAFAVLRENWRGALEEIVPTWAGRRTRRDIIEAARQKLDAAVAPGEEAAS